MRILQLGRCRLPYSLCSSCLVNGTDHLCTSQTIAQVWKGDRHEQDSKWREDEGFMVLFGMTVALCPLSSPSDDYWGLFDQTDEASLETKKPSLVEVISEGGLAIVAGSDTVATALTSLIYLLLAHPEAMKRVKAEVDQVYPPSANALDPRMHSRLVFLDACLLVCFDTFDRVAR